MNVELLRKVKQHILEQPERLLMSRFITEKVHEDQTIHYQIYDTLVNSYKAEIATRPYPPCKTAACIAGWTCILKNVSYNNDDTIFSDLAAGLLDLQRSQALRLFYPHLWPKQFKSGLVDDGSKEAAEATAARIEHFIATEGRE